MSILATKAEFIETVSDLSSPLTSILETFYEVVALIESRRNAESPHPAIEHIQDTQGTGGFWELAQKLTAKFETKYIDEPWDGGYLEAVETFVDEELNKLI